jgi:hypothetical protein
MQEKAAEQCPMQEKDRESFLPVPQPEELCENSVEKNEKQRG